MNITHRVPLAQSTAIGIEIEQECDDEEEEEEQLAEQDAVTNNNEQENEGGASVQPEQTPVETENSNTTSKKVTTGEMLGH